VIEIKSHRRRDLIGVIERKNLKKIKGFYLDGKNIHIVPANIGRTGRTAGVVVHEFKHKLQKQGGIVGDSKLNELEAFKAQKAVDEALGLKVKTDSQLLKHVNKKYPDIPALGTKP